MFGYRISGIGYRILDIGKEKSSMRGHTAFFYDEME